jgi:hypothetical protein
VITQLQTKFDDSEVDGYPTSSPEQVSEQHGIPMVEPDTNQKRLARHNKPSRKTNLTSSETICPTPTKRKRLSTSIRRPTKSNSKSSHGHSPARIRTRTSSNNDQSLPSSSTKCKRKLNLDIVNKQEQQKNKTRSLPKNTSHFVPVQTNKNVHPTSQFTIHQTPNVQSVITALLSAQQAIQHMQIQFQIVPWNLPMTSILTHIRPPIMTTLPPSSSTNPTSITPTGNPPKSPPRHQISPTSTPSTMETTSTLFPTKHHSNTNRTVNRILKFFEGSSAGTAEAYTTIQLVRHIKNFIIYLIRYGLRKFTKFGTKINLLASYFDALNEPDSVDSVDLSPCVAYIEQKKGSRNVFFQITIVDLLLSITLLP